MESEAANLPENLPNIQESGLDTQGGWGSAPECGIKGPYGTIFTRFYKKFKQLYDDENQDILDERKHLNIPNKSHSKRRNTRTTNSE